VVPRLTRSQWIRTAAALLAVLAIVAGAVGMEVYGAWARTRECQAWADSHGYQSAHINPLYKTRNCSARTREGGELTHDPDPGTYATILTWQAGIFAAGCLPLVAGVLIVELPAVRARRRRQRDLRSPGLDRLMRDIKDIKGKRSRRD
jgi:hypothetical protein